MMRLSTLIAGVLLALTVLHGCSTDADKQAADPLAVPEACATLEVDRFKELMIVDESVLTDDRALNAKNGPWSLRYVLGQLAPPGMRPEELISRWLDGYRVEHRVNLFRVERRGLVMPDFHCKWLRATPANECSKDCSECKATELDLEVAPFRLIGIANRIDLRETERPEGAAGEGRLVFAMTDGPGDDPASRGLPGSIIFEYRLPLATLGVRQWAEAWHALGRHPSFDESYKSELQALTDKFVTRGAEAGRFNGSALGQLRTNERLFEWQWDLREYKLAPVGFVVSPTRNSPDVSVYSSRELADWVRENADAVRTGTHLLPAKFTGGASQPLTDIRPESLAEDLRRAFAKETCAGCHNLEGQPIDINFQVSPFKKGPDRLAVFLHNPADMENDELARRTKSLRRSLCFEAN